MLGCVCCLVGDDLWCEVFFREAEDDSFGVFRFGAVVSYVDVAESVAYAEGVAEVWGLLAYIACVLCCCCAEMRCSVVEEQFDIALGTGVVGSDCPVSSYHWISLKVGVGWSAVISRLAGW